MKWLNTTDYNGPYGMTWKCKIKEGKMEEYQALVYKIWATVGNDVREVDGLHIDIKDPNVVWGSEKWINVAAAKQIMEEGMNSEEWKKLFALLDGAAHMGFYKLKEGAKVCEKK